VGDIEEKVVFSDYKNKGKTLLPGKLEVISNSISTGKTIYHNMFHYTYNNQDEKADDRKILVPQNFGLLQVQDERFEPILTYYAKGQLPSEEKILIWAGDYKLLQQHNVMMQKMGR
jgi:hypothetical protein